MGRRKNVTAVLSCAAAIGIVMLGKACWGGTTLESEFFNQYKLVEADGIGAYRECSVIQGNTILAKDDETGSWGAVNTQGDVIQEFKYDSYNTESGGFWSPSKNGQFILIEDRIQYLFDSNGAVITQCALVYDNTSASNKLQRKIVGISEDIYMIQTPKEVFYYRLDGSLVYSGVCNYSAQLFYEGYAVVDEKVIDKNGTVTSKLKGASVKTQGAYSQGYIMGEPDFLSSDSFVPSMFSVEENRCIGLEAEEGIDSLYLIFADGSTTYGSGISWWTALGDGAGLSNLGSVCMIQDNLERWHVIDFGKLTIIGEDGKYSLLNNPQAELGVYDYVSFLGASKSILISKDGQWGYLNIQNGDERVYLDATNFYNDKAMILDENGEVCVIDEDFRLCSRTGIYAAGLGALGEVYGVIFPNDSVSYYSVSELSWKKGDLNGDGEIDLDDVYINLRAALSIIWYKNVEIADLNDDDMIDLDDTQIVLKKALCIIE